MPLEKILNRGQEYLTLLLQAESNYKLQQKVKKDKFFDLRFWFYIIDLILQTYMKKIYFTIT